MTNRQVYRADSMLEAPIATQTQTIATNSAEADVVVLGAGISGLVAASILHDQGVSKVRVIDQYDHIGGNHQDVAIDGYTFDVGSFIFQDDSPLLKRFPDLLPNYIVIRPSWARLNPQGVVTEYPFSTRVDILSAGTLEILRMIVSAVAGRLRHRHMTNAGDYARYWVGARFLRRSGLENYMARFCGCSINLIDLTFAESRMGWIRERMQVRALARALRDSVRKKSPRPPLNQQLARPRAGFAPLYSPARQALERRGSVFALGETLNAIRRTELGFEVETNGGVVATGRIISTIPLSQTADLCGIPAEALPSVTLISLFYSFDGDRGFQESILYNFSYEARWKRLTVYSDFYGKVDGRGYFAVEVVADLSGTSAQDAASEFRRHTAANRLFQGDLRLEGSHILKHAYPIFTKGSGESAARTIADLNGFGVESFGRQGGFRYQPTARVSTLEAEAALREV